MTKKLFLNILLIGVVFSFLTSIAETLIFSYGSKPKVPMTQDDLQKIDNMKFREAIEYMEAHSTKLTGFDLLKNDFSSFFMVFQFVKMSLRFFIPILITAFVVAFRVMKLEKMEKQSM
jgi:hypothetical protein